MSVQEVSRPVLNGTESAPIRFNGRDRSCSTYAAGRGSVLALCSLWPPSKAGGRVQGGESVCWGCWGFPCLTKFIGVLFFWFLSFLDFGFLASCFQSFLVSKFLGIKVSKFQRFNDPILPKSHFMFSSIYWSHIQDFQDFIRRVVGIIRRPSFAKCSSFSIFRTLRFAKNNSSKVTWDFLGFSEVSWCLKKWIILILGLGTRPEVLKSWKFGFFGFSHKQIENVIGSNWSRVILRSF